MQDNFTAALRSRIVEISEAILREEIGIIYGSRQLLWLAHQTSEKIDSDFYLFLAVDSETDHLPVDAERKNWSLEALERKDKEIREYESAAKQDVFFACEKLIQKFAVN